MTTARKPDNRSALMTARWADPAYRAKMLAASRKGARATNERVAKRGPAKIVGPAPEHTRDSITVRAKVIEEPAPVSPVAAPVHPSAATVPQAGTENGISTQVATTTAAEPEIVLDPAVMVSLTKGVFALVALRGGDHWNVTDEEIEPIAEPMCRQLARIPFIAALGQNAADLILIGSALGSLIFMRAQQSVELRRAEAERRTLGPIRRAVDAAGNIVELRPPPGETVRVAQADAGNRIQEVREPDEPRINLDPFRASG